MSEEDFGSNDDQPTKRHYFANPLKGKSSQEPARTFSAQEMPTALAKQQARSPFACI